jgi:hypothetical protein
LQGDEHSEAAAAIREGDLDNANVTPAERKLLEFVETLTKEAYKITDEQVQELRDVGWSDEQIAEAVYDGALFNFFVRVAERLRHPPAGLYGPRWPASGGSATLRNTYHQMVSSACSAASGCSSCWLNTRL